MKMERELYIVSNLKPVACYTHSKTVEAKYEVKQPLHKRMFRRVRKTSWYL